jgi:hypothetical protein
MAFRIRYVNRDCGSRSVIERRGFVDDLAGKWVYCGPYD